MTNNKVFSRTMVLQYDTKGAVRYQELADDGRELRQKDPGCLIGTLYVRKSALNGSIPKSLILTIEMGE